MDYIFCIIGIIDIYTNCQSITVECPDDTVERRDNQGFHRDDIVECPDDIEEWRGILMEGRGKIFHRFPIQGFYRDIIVERPGDIEECPDSYQNQDDSPNEASTPLSLTNNEGG